MDYYTRAIEKIQQKTVVIKDQRIVKINEKKKRGETKPNIRKKYKTNMRNDESLSYV